MRVLRPLPGMALLLVACTSEHRGVRAGDLMITGARVMVPPGGTEAVGYFTIRNMGSVADTFRVVGADIAGAAMLHRQAAQGGMVRMEHVRELPIDASDSVALVPGGMHVMMVNLTRQPAAGDTVWLRLGFARAGDVRVPAVVRPYGE